MIEQLQLPARGLVFDALAAGPSTGELVVLLHGFPQTSACWTPMLETLAAAGYRAVAPDQRGYSPPPGPPPSTPTGCPS
jgi:pimeloyl-ACP methyl ester carboxylesterase